NHDYINGSCIAFARDREGRTHVPFMSAPFVARNAGYFSYEDLGNKAHAYDTLDWFTLPRELGRPIWSDPYADVDSSYTVIVTYSVPFYRMENGERVFEGVVTADLSLEWIGQLLQSLPLSHNDYAFL